MSTSKKKTNQFNIYEQKDGLWEEYFHNGVLSFKGNFINGKHDGLCKWYFPTGQLCFQLNVKNGERDGLCIMYEEEGGLAHETFYVNF